MRGDANILSPCCPDCGRKLSIHNDYACACGGDPLESLIRRQEQAEIQRERMLAENEVNDDELGKNA